jgi:hypothetical protein
MKWEGYNRRGGQAMKKLFGAKGLYYLLTIVTLGLLLGASVKWHGA